MLEVEVNVIVTDESTAQESPWLDESERDMMIEQTKAQVEHHIRRSLSRLDLQEPLRVIVTGAYSLETEQMDLSYHIDTDDKQLLLKVISALNR